MQAVDVRGARITVLGAGVSGRSIASLAARLGAGVFVSDGGSVTDEARSFLESNSIQFESGGHTERVFHCDMAVVGSGFPPSAEVVGALLGRGISIIGELDFVMPHLNGKIIGITGSNGKTTTTSLTAHLLASAGGRVTTVGNIGSPVADAAGTKYDFIVAELSSFQLHWADRIELDAAVVTNLAPDHIDWHGSYDNYVRAKTKILSFTGQNGFTIIQDRDSVTLGRTKAAQYRLSWDKSAADGELILNSLSRTCSLGEKFLFGFDNTRLLGSHNLENTAMSMAVAELSGISANTALEALRSFVAPPHRCSLVLERGGVRYVDDSKGTNIAATVAALSSIEGRKVVILGGKGKGEDYSQLAGPLGIFAKSAILMGEASSDIALALDASGYGSYSVVSGMEEAVSRASMEAAPGEVVLLSPACTSWDMYKNYGERGDHFARLVRKLGEDENEGIR
ncbi:MAG: UDP-N-acetylmuramoyl-L-alanine--D-glutamate ligase [Synergistaceae bacterium]|jgi:UDP-N-acetylmuramoylalanine--D-glutamate ligase|nr:UDP-N-acetylmuramoyl-L-alanine--D-glutamate ligase [Synergistaceae bacterium]